MDFSDKDMNWEQGKAYEHPLFLPEFAFTVPEPPFFFTSEGEFQLLKKEEEVNPVFFFQPEYLYNLQGHQEQTEEKPVRPAALKPRVPYAHAKPVGTLSVEERRRKIDRYLEKRSRRSYCKKVWYACRKRVADARIRVKGRFVPKSLAESLRGRENEKNNVSLQALK